MSPVSSSSFSCLCNTLVNILSFTLNTPTTTCALLYLLRPPQEYIVFFYIIILELTYLNIFCSNLYSNLLYYITCFVNVLRLLLALKITYYSLILSHFYSFYIFL